MRYFLGVDVGNTKSHALVADESGRALGFGAAGMGSWEGLGWDGAQVVLHEIVGLAFAQADIGPADICGAGFGYAGYDWPEDRPGHERIIGSLGLVNAVWDVGNDVVIGLFAGAEEGWGVVVSAGTSNNCYGRDRRGRTCQMTGAGATFGEYGGASEVMRKALQAVSLAWSRRGPATALSQAFVAAGRRRGCGRSLRRPDSWTLCTEAGPRAPRLRGRCSGRSGGRRDHRLGRA